MSAPETQATSRTQLALVSHEVSGNQQVIQVGEPSFPGRSGMVARSLPARRHRHPHRHREMASLTRIEEQPPFAALKQVPPHWLVLISGGLCALATLAIAGLTGYPGGGAGSISLSTGQPVALSSRSTGSFVHVSLADGLLKAGAKTASDKVSHFYLVPVTEATVARLRVAAAATAKLASKWEDIKTVSRSGCNCTGFSNEHGFGRYCHSWELTYQDAWCYVDETCKGGNKGSFGRHHEVCTPEPPPPPKDEYNYSDHMRNKNNEEYVGKWQAPKECPCSGWQSKLGFGGSCKAWEEKLAPHQTPWCYVADSCALAEKKKGSFGRKHMDCVYEYTDSAGSTPKPLVQGPIKPKAGTSKTKGAQPLASYKGGQESSSFLAKLWHGRRLQQEYPTTRSDRKRERQQFKSNEHVAEETALLARVARERPRWVALISAATHGFVTVEPPPHKSALIAHAKSPQLSLLSLFALLPSGAAIARAPHLDPPSPVRTTPPARRRCYHGRGHQCAPKRVRLGQGLLRFQARPR